MFCPKCGTEALEGAVFCQKCGAKVPVDGAVSQSAELSAPINQVQSEKPAKKKSKLPFILGAVALVIVAIIFVSALGGDNTDYVATVRAHKPFNASQGLPYTYGEVFDRYIVSAKWEVRQSGDAHYVDISGRAKGTDCDIAVTIRVSEDPDDPNMAKISPESVTIGDEKTSTQNDAVEKLLAIFAVYDAQGADLSLLGEVIAEIELALGNGEAVASASGLCFRGVPVDALLGASHEDMVSLLGRPNSTMYENEENDYGDATISFDMWSLESPYLCSITSRSLDDVTYNGRPLSDRYDELSQIMGREPDDARVFYDTYSMTYTWDHMGSEASLTVSTPAAEGSMAATEVSISWWYM